MFIKKKLIFLIFSCVIFRQHAVPPNVNSVLENVVEWGSGVAVFCTYRLVTDYLNDQCAGQCGAYGASAVFSTIVTLAALYRCANPCEPLISTPIQAVRPTEAELGLIEFYKNRANALASKTLFLQKRRL